MKNLFFLSFLLLLMLQAAAQKKDSFDIVSYAAPKGWSKTQKPETLTFSKETGTNFCMISIYKNIEATDNAQTNFDMAWKTLVQENLGVTSTAAMQPGSTDNGWKTKIGSASFDKEGIKGAVILISSSQNNKLVNILSLTNSDVFQKEMETFLASIDLKTSMVAKPNTTTTTVKPPANKSTIKPELWVNRRYSNADATFDRYLTSITDFVVIYPNGDFNPNVPYEGLHNFDQTQQPESWGKFTMQGTKGRFKSKYDDIAVTKKSAVHMEKDGYNFGYFKCLPVDGMRIEGSYTHVSPDWGKDPKLDYLNGAGCQFVIHFKKDGTFDDKGIFSTGGDPNRSNCPGGKGTYNIENFTITFTYNDGRVITRLLTAPPTRNLETYDETIYIGYTAHYKKRK